MDERDLGFMCLFFFFCLMGGSGGFNWVIFDDFGAKLTRRIGTSFMVWRTVFGRLGLLVY